MMKTLHNYDYELVMQHASNGNIAGYVGKYKTQLAAMRALSQRLRSELGNREYTNSYCIFKTKRDEKLS